MEVIVEILAAKSHKIAPVKCHNKTEIGFLSKELL